MSRNGSHLNERSISETRRQQDSSTGYYHVYSRLVFGIENVTDKFIFFSWKLFLENSTDDERIKIYACLAEMKMALPLSFNNNMHLTQFEAMTFDHFRNSLSNSLTHAVWVIRCSTIYCVNNYAWILFQVLIM